MTPTKSRMFDRGVISSLLVGAALSAAHPSIAADGTWTGVEIGLDWWDPASTSSGTPT